MYKHSHQKKSILFDLVSKEGKINNFQQYIDENTNIDYLDSKKRTLLMWTIKNHHIEVFEYLIQNHSHLIDKIDNNQQNIFHYIASNNSDDVTMIELIINTNINGSCDYDALIWMKNVNGLLPKHIAAQSGNKQIFQALDKYMRNTWNDVLDEDDDLMQIKSNVPSRKRRFVVLDDGECSQCKSTKRRRLNSASLTKKSPDLSPSPLCLKPVCDEQIKLNVPSFSLTLNDNVHISRTECNLMNFDEKHVSFHQQPKLRRTQAIDTMSVLSQTANLSMKGIEIQQVPHRFYNAGLFGEGIGNNHYRSEMIQFSERMEMLNL